MDIIEVEDFIQQLSDLSEEHYAGDSSVSTVNVDDAEQVRQQLMGVEKIRQELIRYVNKVDPLGLYSDGDCLDEGCAIMTIEVAVIETVNALLLYEHHMTANNLM